MTDLVKMRADATDARKRVDSLLDVNGELSLSQAEELETADTEYRALREQIKIAEIRESAKESANLTTFEFKGNGTQVQRDLPIAPEGRSFEAMCDDAGARLMRRLGHNVEVRTTPPTARRWFPSISRMS